MNRHKGFARYMTIFALLTVLLFSAGCSAQDAARAADLLPGGEDTRLIEQTAKEAEADGTLVTVRHAVDGDTIEVSSEVAGTHRVRLIGVDTPESAIPGEKPEPLGKAASRFTANALEGQEIRLTFDEDLLDPYDRALAYVTIPGEKSTYNETLLEHGLAQVAIFEPNDRLASGLYEAQQAARERSTGIWSLPAREQCQLADRGNQLGEGTPGCPGYPN